MSWKLVFGLSLAGLLTGLATLFVIPTSFEPHAWVAILAVSGFVIAKHAPGHYFAHGLLVSVVMSVWVSLEHVALFDKYIAIHGRYLAMAPHVASPQLTMALAGTAAGIAAGLVLGLHAWVSSKFIVSARSEFAGW